MENETEKQIKKALKAELAPLLIGLRNEIGALRKQLQRSEKARPDVQKTKVTNQPKPPEVQKVEQTNPQKEVSVKNFPEHVKVWGIRKALANIYDKYEQVEHYNNELLIQAITKTAKKAVTEIKDFVFHVRIVNQTKFPTVMKVQEQRPQKQREVQRVKIENSAPGDAVPVVLVEKGKRRFYNALVDAVNQIQHATDVRTLFQKFSSAGRTFKITTDIASTANNQNENEFVLIRNPAGSGIKISIDDLKFQASGNILTFVRVYRLPTVTDTGVALAVNNTRTDGKPTKSEAFFAPTASAFGTLLETFISTIENNFFTEMKLVDTLLEGEDLLITVQQSSASSQNASFDAHYVEDHI